MYSNAHQMYTKTQILQDHDPRLQDTRFWVEIPDSKIPRLQDMKCTPMYSNVHQDFKEKKNNKIMEKVNSRKILVVFPPTYDMIDAYNKVYSWKPDTIKWDMVNERPIVYAEKKNKFQIRLSSALLDKGIRVLSGQNITIVPTLNNPPLDNPQPPNQPHQDFHDLKTFIREIFKEMVNERTFLERRRTRRNENRASDEEQ